MAEEKVKEKKAPSASKGSKSGEPQQQQQRKKKKHAPDRQQPAWLFPPDDQNPVLNPKQKTDKEVEKETQERLKAISFLKHKAVGAPHREAPPHDLLALVGAFLTSFGFNHTCRIFTQEWVAKAEVLHDWHYKSIGKKKFPKGMPKLLEIYTNWRRDWDLERGDEASGSDAGLSSDDGDAMSMDDKEVHEEETSDSDDSDAMSLDEKPGRGKTQAKKPSVSKSNGITKTDAHAKNSDSSTNTSDSDATSDDPKQKAKSTKAQAQSSQKSEPSKTEAAQNSAITKSKKPVKSSDLSTTSESDADDEKDRGVAQKDFKKGTIDSIVKTLKRKASPSDVLSDGKAKASKSTEDEVGTTALPPKKKAKLQAAKGAEKVEPTETKPKKVEAMEKTSRKVESTEKKSQKVEDTEKKSRKIENMEKKPKVEGTEKKPKKAKLASEGPDSEPKVSSKAVGVKESKVLISKSTSAKAPETQPLVKREKSDSSATLLGTTTDSDLQTKQLDAEKSALPTLKTDSSDSSSSSDSSDGDYAKLGLGAKPTASASSVPASKPVEDAGRSVLTPNGTANAKPPKKKPNAPFQRVSSDTKIDPRYASNAYVPNAYSDRAYEALSATKGKGFTKEKNKKKKGSYRGGLIDVGGGKGIKFED